MEPPNNFSSDIAFVDLKFHPVQWVAVSILQLQTRQFHS